MSFFDVFKHVIKIEFIDVMQRSFNEKKIKTIFNISDLKRIKSLNAFFSFIIITSFNAVVFLNDNVFNDVFNDDVSFNNVNFNDVDFNDVNVFNDVSDDVFNNVSDDVSFNDVNSDDVNVSDDVSDDIYNDNV